MWVSNKKLRKTRFCQRLCLHQIQNNDQNSLSRLSPSAPPKLKQSYTSSWVQHFSLYLHLDFLCLLFDLEMLYYFRIFVTPPYGENMDDRNS